jgi:hypothetical protein
MILSYKFPGDTLKTNISLRTIGNPAQIQTQYLRKRKCYHYTDLFGKGGHVVTSIHICLNHLQCVCRHQRRMLLGYSNRGFTYIVL